MTIDPKRLGAAVTFAAAAHSGQARKRAAGDDRPAIPYVSHLLAVSGLVIEDGGDTDEAVAGLLHDYLEDIDPGGGVELQRQFGARVRELVEACTGPKKDQPGMADFGVRKQVYLDRLRLEQDPGAIRVSLADKVHNARCTVNDLTADGPRAWDRFNAGAEKQLRWYGGLAEAFAKHASEGRADQARADELTRLVQAMRDLANGVRG